MVMQHQLKVGVLTTQAEEDDGAAFKAKHSWITTFNAISRADYFKSFSYTTFDMMNN